MNAAAPNRPLRYFLAVLSGLFLFLSAPGPLEFGPFSCIALVPLFFALQGLSFRQGFTTGLLCGLTYYPLMLYWITIVLGRYGYLPWWISVPVMLLLALYMSLYLAFFSAILCKTARTVPLLWAAPPLWVGLDLARNILFTGFPWQDLGYSLYRFPILIQIADLFGHHGVTFMIVLVNGLIFTLLCQWTAQEQRPRGITINKAMPAAVLLIILAGAYNLITFQLLQKQGSANDTIKVSVLQGNIAQGLKWLPDLQKETVDIYSELTRQTVAADHPDLVVWPETALPFYPLEVPVLQKKVADLVATSNIDLLTGAPHRTGSAARSTDYYNSAFLFSSGNGIIARYDKHHLVPFGEYVPLRKVLFFLGPLVQTIGDFSTGEFIAPVQGRKADLGVLICFESIFPELARIQVQKGADLLVNITNDAWFGRSSAPWQHLSMAVLRAVENRRSLARAANTGISGFIDPTGRLLSLSPLFETAALTAQLPVLKIKTLFTHYGGHFFALFCLVVSVLLMIVPNKISRQTYKIDS